MLIRVLIADVIKGIKLDIYGKKWGYYLDQPEPIEKIKKYVTRHFGIPGQYQTYYTVTDQLTDDSLVDQMTDEIYLVYNDSPK